MTSPRGRCDRAHRRHDAINRNCVTAFNRTMQMRETRVSSIISVYYDVNFAEYFIEKQLHPVTVNLTRKQHELSYNSSRVVKNLLF